MLTKKVILITFAVVAVIAALVLTGYFLTNKEGTKAPDVLPILGPIELPKALHWDNSTKSLYFVDVYTSYVHKYVPETNTHTFARVDNEPLAFIIPLKNTKDKFVISYGPTVAIITWDGVSTRVSQLQQLRQIDGDVYRANEGKVSPSGSLFVGTHSPFLANGNIEKGTAGLYAFSKNGTIKKILSNITVSNGMQWSADSKTFYYIDSLAYTVESYSYDIYTDALTNRKLLLNFTEAKIPGVPDGMSIDCDGKIWVTAFNGHQVLRIDPEDGKVLETIQLDALQVTSAAFTGPYLNDFYISTGAYKLSQTDRHVYSHSGWIYRENNFKVKGLRAGVPFEVDSSYYK